LVVFLPVATRTKEIAPAMDTATITMGIVGGFGVAQVITMDTITTVHMDIGDHPTCVAGGASGRLITIITQAVVVEVSVDVVLVVLASLVVIVRMGVESY